jgi:hypothetical protein
MAEPTWGRLDAPGWAPPFPAGVRPAWYEAVDEG